MTSRITAYTMPSYFVGRLAETIVLNRYMTKLMIRRNRHLAAVLVS
jgi:hypothetical protein